MTNLTTEAELATEVLRLPLERVARMRQRQRWPHVRFGRFDVRYTDQQIEQIVREHSVAPTTTQTETAGKAAGLTQRSASRQSRRGRAAS